jgi:formylglycine-generating enzyme required for sulfatase activity
MVDGGPTGSLQWVCIPGGTFLMGSASGGNSDERPVIEVTVPSFEMLQTEVTVSQYRECVDGGPCTAPGTAGLCNWSDEGTYAEHPVNCVNWEQMEQFCAWVGGRLPSEAQWEYAARSGGQAITYPWGNEAATCDYAVMDDATHSDGCDNGRTRDVCSTSAGNTAHGLCDMAGNVWEWMQDWYHDSYTGAPDNGSAWVVPSGAFRSMRSGSFALPASEVRAAYRGALLPALRGPYVGARCVRDAP